MQFSFFRCMIKGGEDWTFLNNLCGYNVTEMPPFNKTKMTKYYVGFEVISIIFFYLSNHHEKQGKN